MDGTRGIEESAQHPWPDSANSIRSSVPQSVGHSYQVYT
ncbi:MAG: hypothetical protein OJF49_003334 [Ktedonobacterales bacterium]|nr:MAG: hypothetical protein OJF49_003334 [Ktedonobacterales bacterium]